MITQLSRVNITKGGFSAHSIEENSINSAIPTQYIRGLRSKS